MRRRAGDLCPHHLIDRHRWPNDPLDGRPGQPLARFPAVFLPRLQAGRDRVSPARCASPALSAGGSLGGGAKIPVGAPLTAPGRAYLALGATAGLQAPAELLPLSSGVSSFGRTLSMEDVNLDGFADVLVGASGDLGASTGRVFLFLGNAAGTVPTPLVSVRP